MTSNPGSVAALVIVLIVVVGFLAVYASMCCNIWGIRQRFLKILRWCLCCLTNSADDDDDDDANHTPSQRILASLSRWVRQTDAEINRPTASPEAPSANTTIKDVRTPPPNYSQLTSPSPPTYSNAINRVASKEAVGNGTSWAIEINEKDQTVKAAIASGIENLSYEHTEAKENIKDGSQHCEISRSNEKSDINENKIQCAPLNKRNRQRKQSILHGEAPEILIAHVGNSNFYDKNTCEAFKIISTWSTPFSQCKPFQSEMPSTYAQNSMCHFVNTKFIVDGMKRDSVTRSFIVSPVKLDKSVEAELTSFRNIDNDLNANYDSFTKASPISSRELSSEYSTVSQNDVPKLTVTDPEDKLIYQSDFPVSVDSAALGEEFAEKANFHSASIVSVQ